MEGEGYSLILDGTNASDDAGDRPGMRALRELGVRSPLRECGITKGEVRRLSQEAGLFTWNKPAYACLATRIQTGNRIIPGDLAKVERAEQALAQMGFADFRVRLFHGAAKIQVTEGELPILMEKRKRVTEALEQWFPEVLLDLRSRQESR